MTNWAKPNCFSIERRSALTGVDSDAERTIGGNRIGCLLWIGEQSLPCKDLNFWFPDSFDLNAMIRRSGDMPVEYSFGQTFQGPTQEQQQRSQNNGDF